MIAPTTTHAADREGTRIRGGRVMWVLAVVLISVSVLSMAAVAVAGPSAAVAGMGHGMPPWHLDLGLSDLTATALCWAGIISGGLGTGAGLAALALGARPRARTLLIASVAAAAVLAVVSGAGSTDALDYAIYGRITALGRDPFVVTPGRMMRAGDPVAHYAPLSWRTTPSAYGPMGVALFGLASLIGGASMAATVFVIKLMAGAAFVLTAIGLDRLAGPDPAARARVHVLWSLNPVMLWEIVAGAHVDGIAAAFLVGLGLIWMARRAPRTIVSGAIAAAIVAGTGYQVAGRSALDALAGKATGKAETSPWTYVVRHAGFLGPLTTSTGVVTILAFLVLAAIVWWGVPGSAGQARLLPMFALSLGWLATSPLQHPWYDAMLFPALALLPGGPLDGLIIARLVVGALAYVPGDPADLRPYWLNHAVKTVFTHQMVSPILDLLIAAIALACRYRRTALRGRSVQL